MTKDSIASSIAGKIERPIAYARKQRYELLLDDIVRNLYARMKRVVVFYLLGFVS